MGCAVVGIYPTSIGEELRHILTLSRARVVIAEDQEQVDKLLRLLSEEAPADSEPLLVERIVYYALVYAFTDGLDMVDAGVIEQVVTDRRMHGNLKMVV